MRDHYIGKITNEAVPCAEYEAAFAEDTARTEQAHATEQEWETTVEALSEAIFRGTPTAAFHGCTEPQWASARQRAERKAQEIRDMLASDYRQYQPTVRT